MEVCQRNVEPQSAYAQPLVVKKPSIALSTMPVVLLKRIKLSEGTVCNRYKDDEIGKDCKVEELQADINGALNDLITKWELYSEHYSDNLKEKEVVFLKLLRTTGKIVFHGKFFKEASNESKCRLADVIESCSFIHENASFQMCICLSVPLIVHEPWSRFIGIQPSTLGTDDLESIWNAEGWILLEERLKALLTSKMFDIAAVILEIFITKGQQWYNKVSDNVQMCDLTDHSNPLHFKFESLIQYVKMYIILWNKNQEKLKFSVRWNAQLIRHIIEVILPEPEKTHDESPLCPNLKGWNKIKKIAPKFLLDSMWCRLKMPDSDLETLGCLIEYGIRHVTQGDMSRGMLLIQDMLTSTDEVCSSSYIYVLGKIVKINKVGMPVDLARNTFIEIYCRAMMSDIKTLEFQKAAEKIDKGNILLLQKRLSDKYVEMADYMTDFPASSFQLILTAHTLHPQLYHLERLFPEVIETENNPKVSTLDHTIMETAEVLGLTSTLYEVLSTVIHSPRLKVICSWTSIDELKSLCTTLINSGGELFVEKNKLEYLHEKDFDKIPNLKPISLPYDDGIEKGYGPQDNIPQRKKSISAEDYSCTEMESVDAASSNDDDFVLSKKRKAKAHGRTISKKKRAEMDSIERVQRLLAGDITEIYSTTSGNLKRSNKFKRSRKMSLQPAPKCVYELQLKKIMIEESLERLKYFVELQEKEAANRNRTPAVITDTPINDSEARLVVPDSVDQIESEPEKSDPAVELSRPSENADAVDSDLCKISEPDVVMLLKPQNENEIQSDNCEKSMPTVCVLSTEKVTTVSDEYKNSEQEMGTLLKPENVDLLKLDECKNLEETVVVVSESEKANPTESDECKNSEQTVATLLQPGGTDPVEMEACQHSEPAIDTPSKPDTNAMLELDDCKQSESINTSSIPNEAGTIESDVCSNVVQTVMTSGGNVLEKQDNDPRPVPIIEEHNVTPVVPLTRGGWLTPEDDDEDVIIISSSDSETESDSDPIPRIKKVNNNSANVVLCQTRKDKRSMALSEELFQQPELLTPASTNSPNSAADTEECILGFESPASVSSCFQGAGTNEICVNESIVVPFIDNTELNLSSNEGTDIGSNRIGEINQIESANINVEKKERAKISLKHNRNVMPENVPVRPVKKLSNTSRHSLQQHPTQAKKGVKRKNVPKVNETNSYQSNKKPVEKFPVKASNEEDEWSPWKPPIEDQRTAFNFKNHQSCENTRRRSLDDGRTTSAVNSPKNPFRRKFNPAILSQAQKVRLKMRATKKKAHVCPKDIEVIVLDDSDDEKGTNNTTLPPTVLEKGTNNTSPPPTLLEKGTNNTSPPPTVLEKGTNNTSPPPTLLEKGTNKTSPPPTLLETGTNNTSLPPTLLEKGTNNTSLPPTLLEKGTNNTSLPPTLLEKGTNNTSLPPTLAEKGTNNTTPPPTLLEKENSVPSTMESSVVPVIPNQDETNDIVPNLDFSSIIQIESEILPTDEPKTQYITEVNEGHSREESNNHNSDFSNIILLPSDELDNSTSNEQESTDIDQINPTLYLDGSILTGTDDDPLKALLLATTEPHSSKTMVMEVGPKSGTSLCMNEETNAQNMDFCNIDTTLFRSNEFVKTRSDEYRRRKSTASQCSNEDLMSLDFSNIEPTLFSSGDLDKTPAAAAVNDNEMNNHTVNIPNMDQMDPLFLETFLENTKPLDSANDPKSVPNMVHKDETTIPNLALKNIDQADSVEVETVEPIQPEPIEPELVEPEPIEPEPIEPEHIEPEPMESEPIEPEPLEPEPLEPEPIEPVVTISVEVKDDQSSMPMLSKESVCENIDLSNMDEDDQIYMEMQILHGEITDQAESNNETTVISTTDGTLLIATTEVAKNVTETNIKITTIPPKKTRGRPPKTNSQLSEPKSRSKNKTGKKTSKNSQNSIPQSSNENKKAKSIINEDLTPINKLDLIPRVVLERIKIQKGVTSFTNVSKLFSTFDKNGNVTTKTVPKITRPKKSVPPKEIVVKPNVVTPKCVAVPKEQTLVKITNNSAPCSTSNVVEAKISPDGSVQLFQHFQKQLSPNFKIPKKVEVKRTSSRRASMTPKTTSPLNYFERNRRSKKSSSSKKPSKKLPLKNGEESKPTSKLEVSPAISEICPELMTPTQTPISYQSEDGDEGQPLEYEEPPFLDLFEPQKRNGKVPKG